MDIQELEKDTMKYTPQASNEMWQSPVGSGITFRNEAVVSPDEALSTDHPASVETCSAFN